MVLQFFRSGWKALLLIAMILILLPACRNKTPDGQSTLTESGQTADADSPSPDDMANTLADLLASAQDKYMCGDASLYYEFQDQPPAAFSEICDELEREGYERYSSWEISQNRFVTYRNGKNMRHIGYLGETSTLTVVTSKLAGDFLPAVGEEYQPVCQPSVTQIGSWHLNGMGYIIQFADGSFAILDGGYADCAEELYNQLCKLNGSPDRIRVRAWILSHAHPDHYDCFSSFASVYGLRIAPECIMVAMPNYNDCENTYFHDNLRSVTDNFLNGSDIPILGVHTGMTFRFADTTLEMIYSPDSLFHDSAPSDFNESSIILRVSNENGSAIFLGDAGNAACSFAVKHFGDTLKSDMVQVSHHGCETATLTIYSRIRAAVLFWPCDHELYDSSRNALVKYQLRQLDSTKVNYLQSDGSQTVLFASLR